ncbi:hypothetical protein [Kitasatospora sp. NPDC094011]|uniref:hypothetical protein n=1 Tax=Kitasatospora sp. NPDC094011 TaxID=3364090 RepID=UPI00381959AF
MIDVILITCWLVNRKRARTSMGAEHERYAFRATVFGILEVLNLAVSFVFVMAYLHNGGGR